jgi:hypothetical protein
MSECERTILRRGQESQACKRRKHGGALDMIWKGRSNWGSQVKGKCRELWHFVQPTQPDCEFWPRICEGCEYLEMFEPFKE